MADQGGTLHPSYIRSNDSLARSNRNGWQNDTKPATTYTGATNKELVLNTRPLRDDEDTNIFRKRPHDNDRKVSEKRVPLSKTIFSLSKDPAGRFAAFVERFKKSVVILSRKFRRFLNNIKNNLSIRLSLIVILTSLLLASMLFVYLFTSRGNELVGFDLVHQLQDSDATSIASAIQDYLLLAEEKLLTKKAFFLSGVFSVDEPDRFSRQNTDDFIRSLTDGLWVTLLNGSFFGCHVEAYTGETYYWTPTNGTIQEVLVSGTGEPYQPLVVRDSISPLPTFQDNYWTGGLNLGNNATLNWYPLTVWHSWTWLTLSTGLYDSNGTTVGVISESVRHTSFEKIFFHFYQRPGLVTLLIDRQQNTILTSSYGVHGMLSDCVLDPTYCPYRLRYTWEVIDPVTTGIKWAINATFGSWKNVRRSFFKVSIPNMGDQFITTYPISHGPNIDWILLRMDAHSTVISEDQNSGLQLKTALTFVIAGMLTFLFAWTITRPLISITSMIQKLLTRVQLQTDEESSKENENFNKLLEKRSYYREIRNLQVAFAGSRRMVQSFTKFVPDVIVNRIITGSPLATGLYVERRYLSIFFSALVSFTTLAESIDPAIMLQMLSEYLESCTTIIAGQDGFVGDFVGDNIMAFHGAPDMVRNHATKVCMSALMQQKALIVLNEKWGKRNIPKMRSRMGIHSGFALTGNIGSPERLKYGIVGDSVNLASRLENLNKRFQNTSIIISEDTRGRLRNAFETRPLETVIAKGRVDPTEIHELLGRKGQVPLAAMTQARRYKKLYEYAWQFTEPGGDPDTLLELQMDLKTYTEEYPTDSAGHILMEQFLNGYMEPTRLSVK